MKEILLVKKRVLSKILVLLGVSITGLMTTCAKYGVLVSTYYMKLKGTVKSEESSQVIPGIQVEVTNSLEISKRHTDDIGAFSVDSEISDFENVVILHISDIDSTVNGSFLSKDTVITLTSKERHAGVKENIEIKLAKNE